MLRISALYPNQSGSHFDVAYYLGSHAALAKRLLGPQGLSAVRVTIGEASLDGSPPSFWAISEMHFSDRGAFDAAMATCGAELVADANNYTDVSPIMQVSSLVEEN